jgi:hypothetical protein
MAAKQPGEYSLEFVSFRYSPGTARSVIVEGNYKGTATGLGVVLGTATLIGGKSGSLGYCSSAYLDNGDQLFGQGTGTYESVGQHGWRTQGSIQSSDGRVIREEGEVDLAKTVVEREDLREMRE